MNLFLKFIVLIIVMSFSTSIANENFFNEAKILYEEEKYDESKFLFQRNIVFNPKDAKSYLYLAKIYNHEENENEEIKNLNTALLLSPDNEEAKKNYENNKMEVSKFLFQRNIVFNPKDANYNKNNYF